MLIHFSLQHFINIRPNYQQTVFKDAQAGRPCTSILRKFPFVTFRRKNQIIIRSIKHAMCDKHIND